ncbi:hypothetical protein [Streptomyces luteolifulvus]|uniref:hypothetical protein n=1 Tax=Streptomyces luteolifulvus TaxID=2615112 RepID=UPI0038B61F6A
MDGDGVVDEVHDSKDRDGRTVVTFEGPGNKQVRHSVSSIVTTAAGRTKARASPEEGFRAAFGDFDNDGRVDMAVTYTARDEGDDPVDSMSQHEVRWGPLGRDLKGKSRGSIRMSQGYYIDGLRAVAGNQHSASANPAPARLLIHQTTGDGAFETYQGQKLGHDLVVPDEPLNRWGQAFAEQKDGWADLGECPASPRSTATGPFANRTGLSKSTIGRIWKRFGIKPHLQDAFKLSTDPQFIAKAAKAADVPATSPARPRHAQRSAPHS